MNLNGLLILEKYHVLRKLGEGRLGVVYLVEDIKNEKKQYALKILKPDHIKTTRFDVVQYTSEVSIVSRLSHPNIVKVIDSGMYTEQYFLVMEYIKGSSLESILKTRKKLSIDDSIAVIKNLAAALDYIHSHNIIHRDIKPGNILVPLSREDSGFDNIKLIDFGLAHIANLDIKNETHDIIGTLDYMAPECSGITNRSIDQRSDIYSLGIILYQLLSGKLPFSGSSIDDIIQKQIENNPEPFIKIAPEVPDILEKIVLKMIEKEPDKRYQSAAGILYDLNQVLKGNYSFHPGANEKIHNPLNNIPFVARKNQLQLLKNLYREAEDGAGSFCLISGSAGSGKTRLGEELKKSSPGLRGVFLNAKCYPAFSRIPYNPFWDILNAYIDIFKNKPAKEKEDIVEKIRQAIGDLGSILIKLNPRVKEIIGECYEAVPLDPEREWGRFYLTIGELFRVISEVEGVLVIQVDNLQWSDETSILLLRELAFKIEEKNLLILGTYRDDDVETNSLHLHLLSRVDDFNRFEEISCSLLQREELSELIQGIFHQNDKSINDLVDFVYLKSKGNPYFTIEILREMINNHILHLEDNTWYFYKERAEEIEISPRVIDIILKRISLLEHHERRILGCAAILGRKFNIDMLISVIKESKNILNSTTGSDEDALENEILMLIEKASHLQILEPFPQNPREMVFTHTRIQDMLYQDMAYDERKSLHHLIARILEEDRYKESHLFDIAHHYIYSDDFDRIIYYASQAGFNAAEKYANSEAIKYLSIAIDTIEKKYPSFGHKPHHELWVKCKFRLGELYILVAELEKALSIFSDIINLSDSVYNTAKIYKIMCRATFQMADWHSLEQYAKIGLGILNEKLPLKKFSVSLYLLKELCMHFIHHIFPQTYRMRPRNKVDERERLKIELYLIVGWMYILSDGIKFARTVLRILNLSESRIGFSKELALSMASYATLCMSIPLFERSKKYHLKAIQIRESFNDEWGLAQSFQWLAYGLAWQGRSRDSNEYFTKSLSIYRKVGDVWEMGMCLGGMAYNKYSSSHYEQCMNYLREYLSISLKISDYFGVERSYDTYALCFIEKGDYKSAREYINEAYKVSIKNYLKFSLFYNYSVHGYLYLEEGKYDEAVNIFNKAVDMDNKNVFIPFFTSYVYPLLAEALLRKLIDQKKYRLVLSRLEIKKVKKQINKALKRSKPWPGIFGMALMVKALFYAMNGHNRISEIVFNKCINIFRETGRKYFLAKVLLEFGILLKNWGRDNEAERHLKESHELFKSIGSVLYAKRVSDFLDIEKNVSPEDESPVDQYGPKLESINKLNKAIRSMDDVDEILKHIMEKALEVTGAMRGFLFLRETPDSEAVLKVSVNHLPEHGSKYSENILKTVLNTGEALISTDAGKDRRFRPFQSITFDGLKSILCIPILSNSLIIGACYMDNPLQKGAFTDDDRHFLGLLLINISMVLENKLFQRNLEKTVDERTRELDIANKELADAYISVSKAFDIIKEDLAMARDVQNSILSGEVNNVKGLDIDLRFLPMGDVGGDIYDIYEIKDGVIRIFVADATGHGVQAALITMAIISEYNKMKNIVKSPADILDRLNRILFNLYGDIRIIFSSIVADVHIKDKKIIYASAGHPSQYIIRDNEIIELEKTGRIVGLIDGSVFNNNEYYLMKGDKILLFTDGFYEHLNNERLSYGQNRLKKVILDAYEEPLTAIIDRIFDDIEDFLHYGKKSNDDDDVTVLGITLKE